MISTHRISSVPSQSARLTRIKQESAKIPPQNIAMPRKVNQKHHLATEERQLEKSFMQ
jgi:hypothetical protein